MKVKICSVTAWFPLTKAQWDRLQNKGMKCFDGMKERGISDIDWDAHFGRCLFFTVERTELVETSAELLMAAIKK